MKRLNLGRLILTLLLPILMYAKSIATLSSPIIYKGDSVTLNIEASGDDIKFPKIDNIGGFNIEGVSTSQSITSINGKTTKKLIKSYTFTPTKSITIPSFSINVDGSVEKTKPLKLEVTKPTPSSSSSPLQLELKIDKDEAYVGEEIELKLIFKKLPNADFDKVELAEPNIKGFWVKKDPNPTQGAENGYITQTYTYYITPQQAGKFDIPATFAKIGKIKRDRHSSALFNDPFFNDSFFNGLTRRIAWKKIFSNDLSINIKPLPQDLEIFGDFNIDTKVDKKEVMANKPTNLTITIKGEGNLDDISKFDLNIDDTIIYSDEPTIDKDRFIQKVAIIADKNYTIPAISFSYFDKKNKTKKTIKSKPINIVVKGGLNTKKPIIIEKNNQNQNLITKTNQDKSKIDTTSKKETKNSYLLFLAGVFAGILLSYLYLIFKNQTKKKKDKKELTIIQKIDRSKSDKELFTILLPFANKDNLIKESLKKLEENIYKNSNHKIDKEQIVEIFLDTPDD